jgi:hypothetical protein
VIIYGEGGRAKAKRRRKGENSEHSLASETENHIRSIDSVSLLGVQVSIHIGSVRRMCKIGAGIHRYRLDDWASDSPRSNKRTNRYTNYFQRKANDLQQLAFCAYGKYTCP